MLDDINEAVEHITQMLDGFRDFLQGFGYKKRDGDGITLPGALRVAEAHSGDVTFETDPEKGSTCTLILPLTR